MEVIPLRQNVNINIEGFTLSGCYYEGTNAYECGAVCAELAQGVTLRNCVIEGNRARHGGGAGLTVSGSTVHVADCIFTGNKAADAGAPPYVRHVVRPVLKPMTRFWL